jgi:hypothetical protein
MEQLICIKMKNQLHIEGETFETAFVPLNHKYRPGVFVDVKFYNVPDSLPEHLKTEEDKLWNLKVAEAAAKGQKLTRGFQYGLELSRGFDIEYRDRKPIFLGLPVSDITYSRIELAKSQKSREIPNVLAFCEVVLGKNGYLFVERGGAVAYHGGTSQLHALVAGNYPRDLPQIKASEMSVDKWLSAQQETEQKIAPNEIQNRQLLGIILDRTLGYKPDVAFIAETNLSKEEMAKRSPIDKWEMKGIQEFPGTVNDLTNIILEHQDIKRHVPPGFGAAILELARIGGLNALRMLNYEGKQHGAPLIQYHQGTDR